MLFQQLVLVPLVEILLNSLDHFVSHFGSLGKPWREVRLNLLEFLSISIHMAQRDTFTPVLSIR